MPDDRELEGLDPYELLDKEAARIDSFLSAIPDGDPRWDQPTACSAWNRRQLLGHLASTEEYHHACLGDTLADFIAKGVEAGATDVDSFNELGIEARSGMQPSDVLAEWRAQDADTRGRLRERGSGDMTTMVGPYPARWQSFHIASELAIHADDLGVPDGGADVEDRLAWRAKISRFFLAESKPDLELSATGGGTAVKGDGMDLTVDDQTFVNAVAGRLDDSSALGDDERLLLNITP